MIDPTAGVGATASSTATSSTSKNSVADAQDRFLKLLVTQMKNQDPLNPMDNAQVTSQMAQLSTVSGIDKLNATLQALSSSMQASQTMQAASMIGHAVMVPGNHIDLANGKGVAALSFTKPADSASVTITDDSGNVVRTLNLGSQSEGYLPLQWDGLNDAGQPLPDGSYRFSASAKLGGVQSSVDAMSYGLVRSVSQGTQGVTLDVGTLGDISMAEVKQIL